MKPELRQHLGTIKTFANFFTLLPLSEEEKAYFLSEFAFWGQIFGIKYEVERLEEFLKELVETIDNFLKGKLELKKEVVVPTAKIKEWEEIYEKQLENLEETSIERLFPSPSSEIIERYKQLCQNLEKQLKETSPTLAQNPKTAILISRLIAYQVISQSPQVATEQAFEKIITPIEHQKRIIQIIENELRQIGIEPPPKNLLTKIAEAILPINRTLAAIPHAIAVPLISLVRKPPSPEAPTIVPKLTDLPFLRWRPTGKKISLPVQIKARIKEIISTPLRLLTRLAPEKFREENIGLIYAASGFTPEAVRKTRDHLEKESPESPEIPFWQNLEAIFGKEKSPLVKLFEAYFEKKLLGKVASKFPDIPESSLAKILTLGKIKNLPKLKETIWNFFKKTGIGRFFSQEAEKILQSLSKQIKIGIRPKLSLPGIIGKIIGPVSPKIKRGVGNLFTNIRIVSRRTFYVTRDFFVKISFSVNTFFFNLTAVSFSTKLISFLLLIPLLILAIFVFIVIIIIQGAFIPSVEGPAPLGFAENKYLRLEKTAEPSRVREIDFPARVTYTIKVTPLEPPLTNVTIEEELIVVPQQPPPRLELIEPNNLPTTIDSEIILRYRVGIDQTFNNSYIINTFRVSFTAPDGTRDDLEVSYPLMIGTPPASDCPLPPGIYFPNCKSYAHPTEPCHGTSDYWEIGGNAQKGCVGRSPNQCCYGIPYTPQFPGEESCLGPSNPTDPKSGEVNVCYGLYGPGGAYENQDALCNAYGYATDVAAPAHTPVSLPTVNGQCVRWAYFSGYQSGWGHGTVFKVIGSCDGSQLPFIHYEMAFIHLDRSPAGMCTELNPCESGTVIAGLYASSAPHLHIEVRIDNHFIPPDNICP